MMSCTWEMDPGCISDEWEALDPDLQQRSLTLATQTLQMLTLNRVGRCPSVIRLCPVKPRCGCGWVPRNHNGQWINDCGCETTCAPISEIEIPVDIASVHAIIVDGEVIAAAESWSDPEWPTAGVGTLPINSFRIDNGNLLVWQGAGPSPIPETQDLNKPLTEPGTWGLVVSDGYPLTDAGRVAVAQLAMEFANACTPRKKCGLPKGVTNVTRAGVSFNIETGLFPGGLTGIEIVDAFILQWAPAGAPSQAAIVYDPRSAMKQGRRTSTRPGSWLAEGIY